VAAQDGVDGSTLELYRKALKLRRELQTSEELQWQESGRADVLQFTRPGNWQTVTNFGDAPVELPAGEVLVSSGPLDGGLLPANTTVWLR
jgi:alpha-glucosidase